MLAWKLFPVLLSFALKHSDFLQHYKTDHTEVEILFWLYHFVIFRKFSFNNFTSSLDTTDIEFNPVIF